MPLLAEATWLERLTGVLDAVFGGESAFLRAAELELWRVGWLASRWAAGVLGRHHTPAPTAAIEAMLRDHRPQLVAVDDATRDAVWDLVRRHLATGGTPEQIATLLRYRVGLTPGQQAAVDRFAASLERGGLSEVARAQAAADYARRLRLLRARTIATTETGFAWNATAEVLYAQWGLPARFWWTRRDERVRASHHGLHGVCRPAGEPWRTIWGNTLRFPHDPDAPAEETVNCRCVTIPSAADCGRRPLGPLANLEQRLAAAGQADRSSDQARDVMTTALAAAFIEQELALERALAGVV